MSAAKKKCAYKNCTRSYMNSPNLSFFKFPVKNIERCKKWITNCGQDGFTNVPDSTLMNKVLCSLHFKDSAFTDPSKKRLLPNNHDYTVPVPWFTNESVNVSNDKIDSFQEQTGELLKYRTEDTIDLVDHDSQPFKDSQQNKDNTKLQPKKTNTKSPSPRKKKSMLSFDHDYLPFNDSQQTKDNTKSQPKKTNTKSPSPRIKKPMLSSLNRLRVDHDYLPFNDSQQNKDNTKPQLKKTNTKSPSPRKYKSMLASLKRYRLELKRSRSKIKHLINTRKKLNSVEDISNCLTAYLTGDILTFVKMQLVNKRKVWTEEEKSISLSIYYKSPSTYMFLRKKGFKLPCVTLLRKWIRLCNVSPEFSSKVSIDLTREIESMTEPEKETVLLVTITKGLECDNKKDVIEGSQDLGPLGTSEN